MSREGGGERHRGDTGGNRALAPLFIRGVKPPYFFAIPFRECVPYTIPLKKRSKFFGEFYNIIITSL